MAAEWVPIEELFARLSGLSDHAKRVIEYHLGPEISKRDLEQILDDIPRKASQFEKSFTWFIGCRMMHIWTKDQHSLFDWDQLDSAHVERVVELLYTATVIE